LDEFNDLTILPPEIGALTALTNLDLRDTQVSDIAALSNLTKLTDLDLGSTPVSDLSSLLSLTQLAENPLFRGLSFENTAATKADPRIAEIARIDENAKRATDLFAYLRQNKQAQERERAIAQNVTTLETRVSTAMERLDEFEAQTETRISKAISDYKASINAATQAFRETNALKAPVILW
jgi:Leucine-rich repeat (LRR) protein